MAQLLGISLRAPWANTLTGYARGAELLVQRRSNTGLSGWLSYSFGVNRYRDSRPARRSTAISISGTP